MTKYSDVRPREGGPYSLFCYTCKRWIPNTANYEVSREGGFAHNHFCYEDDGKVTILAVEGLPENGEVENV